MAKETKSQPVSAEQQIKDLQSKLASAREELNAFKSGDVPDATTLGEKHNRSFQVLGLGKNAGHMVRKTIPRAFDESEAIRQYAVSYGITGENVSTFNWRVREIDLVPEDEAEEAPKAKEEPVKQAA